MGPSWEAFWRSVGASWGHLGPSGGLLGRLRGFFGRLEAILGVWEHFFGESGLSSTVRAALLGEGAVPEAHARNPGSARPRPGAPGKSGGLGPQELYKASTSQNCVSHTALHYSRFPIPGLNFNGHAARPRGDSTLRQDRADALGAQIGGNLKPDEATWRLPGGRPQHESPTILLDFEAR